MGKHLVSVRRADCEGTAKARAKIEMEIKKTLAKKEHLVDKLVAGTISDGDCRKTGARYDDQIESKRRELASWTLEDVDVEAQLKLAR